MISLGISHLKKILATNMSEIVADLYWETGSVKIDTQEGFLLASGNRSPIYLDGRLVISYPASRQIILAFANLWVEEILSQHSRQKVVIAGGETVGAILAGSLATVSNLRYVFFRKQAKKHGTKKRVEGKLEPGDKILFFEDIITDGSSAVSFVKAAQEAGAEVYKVVVIVNREQGGRQKLANLPIPVELEEMTTLRKIMKKRIS